MNLDCLEVVLTKLPSLKFRRDKKPDSGYLEVPTTNAAKRAEVHELEWAFRLFMRRFAPTWEFPFAGPSCTDGIKPSSTVQGLGSRGSGFRGLSRRSPPPDQVLRNFPSSSNLVHPLLVSFF